MSFENQSEGTPVQPKTLTPYRRKLKKSAAKIMRVMSGIENLPQQDQIAAFAFVLNEIRKMAGGAAKGLELAQTRDYEAYKALKAQVKAGVPLDQAGASVDGETLSEFQILMANLGMNEAEYKFASDDVDAAGEKVVEFQENKITEAGQNPPEGDQPGF